MSYDPYANNVPAPSFEVTLPDLDDGGTLPAVAWAEQGNRSPAVRWAGLPDGTQSLLITAFDPDAPIPGGFWHWLVKDAPASTDGLAEGAGASDASLPAGASHLVASMGSPAYAGVNPPPGTGTHRLIVCVTALDVERLEVPGNRDPAAVHVAAIAHTLGRGIAVGLSHAPELSV